MYPYPGYGGAGAVSRDLQGRQGRAQSQTILWYDMEGKGVNIVLLLGNVEVGQAAYMG
jgi:hypothetical protein